MLFFVPRARALLVLGRDLYMVEKIRKNFTCIFLLRLHFVFGTCAFFFCYTKKKVCKMLSFLLVFHFGTFDELNIFAKQLFFAYILRAKMHFCSSNVPKNTYAKMFQNALAPIVLHFATQNASAHVLHEHFT